MLKKKKKGVKLHEFHSIQLCFEHLTCPRQGQIQPLWGLKFIVSREVFKGWGGEGGIHNISYFQKFNRNHNHVNTLLGSLPGPWTGPAQVRRRVDVFGSVPVEGGAGRASQIQHAIQAEIELEEAEEEISWLRKLVQWWETKKRLQPTSLISERT